MSKTMLQYMKHRIGGAETVAELDYCIQYAGWLYEVKDDLTQHEHDQAVTWVRNRIAKRQR